MSLWSCYKIINFLIDLKAKSIHQLFFISLITYYIYIPFNGSPSMKIEINIFLYSFPDYPDSWNPAFYNLKGRGSFWMKL